MSQPIESPNKTETTINPALLKRKPVSGSRGVPRSSRAVGTKSTQKNHGVKAAAAFRRKIKEISEAHRIKSLEMSDCLVASREGRFARLETVSILGHMGLGCLLLETSGHTDFESIYDVVEIYEKKAAQDYEKAMIEYEKALQAFEAQEAAKATLEGETTEDPVADPVAAYPVADPVVADPVADQPLIEDDKDLENPSSVWDPTKKPVLTKPVMPEPPKPPADRSAVNLFEEKKALCLEPMVYNVKKQVRHVGEHISKLFEVVRLPNTGFFDFRVNGTKFIIPGTCVYRLVTPSKYPTKWYVVMGDIQMKSQTIKSIDPTYQTPDVIQEHMAMLDRIKAANKTTDLDEELEDEIPALVEELTA